MRVSRRSLMSYLTATLCAFALPRRAKAEAGDVRHILPLATSTSFGISVSVGSARESLSLIVGNRSVPGQKKDSNGRFWSFHIDELSPDTEYLLQLKSADKTLGDPWPLKTFPDAASLPNSFRLLAFTCAGGGDGFGVPGRQFFKPHAFRQNLFDAALAEKPDAAVAIGDHIYWDLRGGNMPAVGRRSPLIKTLAGWYLQFMYGAFDRSKPLLGTFNEDVLTRIGDEQIADLYGTRFRSVPMFFVSDDHDYFENDDAEKELVTFPPDDFSKAAHKAIADLYYPPLPDGPSPDLSRAFGTLRYGQLFEAPLFDCAGHLTLGEEEARLVPKLAENWLIGRASQSPAKHFAFVPSHPMGWTAGKWREWYPDVVAPEGFEGVVTNELLSGVQGKLTARAQKYLWQIGWWRQHQRLLAALGDRSTSRFMLSGDIHAQGSIEIQNSDDLNLTERPVASVLVGPVSTSDVTWPTSARGIAAATPEGLDVTERVATKEVNGFTMFDITPEDVTARLFDCGGHDRSLSEDGSVQRVEEVEII